MRIAYLTALLFSITVCKDVEAEDASTAYRSSNVSVREFLLQLGLVNSIDSNTFNALQSLNDASTATARSESACDLARILFNGTSTNACVSRYLGRSSSDYINRTRASWSDDCWQQPQCILSPTTSQEVAQSLEIIVFTQSKFAVRSGGHNANVGFSNINASGVLIDTVNMNSTTLNNDSTVASIGPGQRMGLAYKWLSERDRWVNGGKDPSPAFGGLLLGGGITFFASNYGMVANGITNAEVVLANSSIIEANAGTNTDLYWAIKGGGPNFGIVTRYDIEAITEPTVWFEYRLYNPDMVPTLIKSMIEYQAAAENDNDSSIVFQSLPGETIMGYIYQQGVEWPTVFEMFKNIPYNTTLVNSTIGTAADLSHATAGAESEVAMSYAGMSVGLRPDLDVYNTTYAAYLEIAAAAYTDFGGVVTYGLQPVTSNTVVQAQRNGGLPLSLAEGAQTWFVTTIQWTNTSAGDLALAAIQQVADAVRSTAEERNVSLPFMFMNDANAVQNVFRGYGDQNRERLLAVAASYDPEQVFQNLQNSGFLLSRST